MISKISRTLHKPVIFMKKNSSTILTCLGVLGLVGTAVLTSKATIKAVNITKEAERNKDDQLTVSETVKLVAPVYVPPILMGIATCGCIFGANVVSRKQQASLLSAYTLLDSSFKEYKNKLKELYGQEAHNNIIDSLMVEKAKSISITNEYFCTNCNLAIEDTNSEPKLFYDLFGKRYFESTIEQVISAEYHLNRNYTLRGYAYLNELYDFLGLEETEYGDAVGWTPTDEGEFWIEFNHHKTTLDDGLECYIIECPFAPSADFLEYY